MPDFLIKNNPIVDFQTFPGNLLNSREIQGFVA